MSKDSAPAAPDYGPLIAAATNQSKLSYQLGQQQLQWAKDQYAQDSATIKPLVAIQTENAKDAAAFAKQQEDFYNQNYQPLEKQFAATAGSWDTPEREQAAAGAAQAGVAQQFDQARTAARQQLESYGLDPSATRYAALDIGTRTGQAAAAAAAGTGAINQTQQQGLALEQAAINVGRGYPGNINATTGTSNASASGATSGTNQTTATGASTMGTGPQWAGIGAASLGQAGSMMNSQYQNQLAQYQANQNSSSGLGSLFGTIAGLGTGGGNTIGGSILTSMFEEGGAVDGQTQGGAIPVAASPSGGQAIDDVPARLTPGEFVIPKDAVSWLGEKHLQDLIKKSREQRQQAVAVPETKPAPQQAPTFASRPVAALPVG